MDIDVDFLFLRVIMDENVNRAARGVLEGVIEEVTNLNFYLIIR